MGNGRGQLDMAHALAAYFGKGNFHTAFLTGYAFKLQSLIFAAQAFVVFYWAKDFGAEQTIALRLKGTVVDGFRLLDFAVRPRADGFGRGNADFDGIEFFFHASSLQRVKQVRQIHFCSQSGFCILLTLFQTAFEAT